jgi:hypothetical protein
MEDDVGRVPRLRREPLLEDVGGLLNLFSKCVPTIWATTVMPMMARIQMVSTVRRRS